VVSPCVRILVPLPYFSRFEKRPVIVVGYGFRVALKAAMSYLQSFIEIETGAS
jgi:hypothetical protein